MGALRSFGIKRGKLSKIVFLSKLLFLKEIESRGMRSICSQLSFLKIVESERANSQPCSDVVCIEMLLLWFFLHWNVVALMVSALKCYCFDVVCNEMLLLWYCLHWNVVTLMLSALKCFYSTVVCIEMLLLWCCLHWNVIALILSALKYCYSNVVCIKMLLLWCCLHLRCCFSAFGRVEVLLHYSSQSSATEMWLLLLDIL